MIQETLTDAEADALLYDWSFWARTSQRVPEGGWFNWLCLAGRGWGKTRVGAETVRHFESRGYRRIALIAPTASDARDVMVEGESGLLAVYPKHLRPKYEPSKRKITFRSGAIAMLYSADEPERLRGPQHDLAWCLAGDTPVLMATGAEKQLADVRIGEMVATRQGHRAVTGSSLMRRNATVYRVSFADGRSLVGTDDHRIWIVGVGFVPIKHVVEGMLTCATDASSGAGLSGTRRRGGTTRRPSASIVQSGRFTAGRSRRASTFTTSTATSPTIGSKTWSAYPTANTVPGIARRSWPLTARKQLRDQLRQPDAILPSIARGFSPVRNAAGRTPADRLTREFTALRPALRRQGQEPSRERPGFAFGAGRDMRPVGGCNSTAQSGVRVTPLLNGRHRGLRRKSPALPVERYSSRRDQTRSSAAAVAPSLSTLRIRSVERLARPRDVYDISVAGAREFFANGVVVHNCDELGSWRYQQEAWDMMSFGLRLGASPRCIITTTPKPLPIIRELVADPTTIISRGSTYENRSNLAPAFFSKVVSKYEGTRLGRQEIHAEVLTDVPGALWTTAMLDACRVAHVPQLVRIVIAVDPAVTSGEDSDECGIVAAGVDRDGHGYLLEDGTISGTPDEWARAAVGLYAKWGADRIVAEVNNGGDLVEAVLRTVDPNIAYRAVRASRGKVRRAEPVAALYEQGRCHHAGTFGLLESQLCLLTADNEFIASPDRADALVWAMTDLMVAEMQPLVYGEWRDKIHLIDPDAIPTRLTRFMAVLPQAVGAHVMVWMGVDSWGDLYAYRELAMANCNESFSAKDHAEVIANLEGAELEWRRAGQSDESATLRPGVERITSRVMALVAEAESWQKRYTRYGFYLQPTTVKADVADDTIREMLRVRGVASRGGDWPRLHVSTKCPALAAEMASLRAEPRVTGDTEPRLVECLRALAARSLRHSHGTESGQ